MDIKRKEEYHKRKINFRDTNNHLINFEQIKHKKIQPQALNLISLMSVIAYSCIRLKFDHLGMVSAITMYILLP